MFALQLVSDLFVVTVTAVDLRLLLLYRALDLGQAVRIVEQLTLIGPLLESLNLCCELGKSRLFDEFGYFAASCAVALILKIARRLAVLVKCATK